MSEKYLKLSILMVFGFLGYFGFMVGCKNAGDPLGHAGPFDVPTATATAITGQVNLTCFVNYGGFQSGVSWNLVDSNGNTINSTTQMSGNTAFSFIPAAYGVYSVNIPTQLSSKYLYSSQAVTITNVGNYSVTFLCSNQTLSTNPSSFTYQTSLGNQTPVTLSYSFLGNLNVPVSILTSGLSSAFVVSPTTLTLSGSGSSAPLTVTKNTCANTDTSLSFSANDFGGISTGANSSVSIMKGYPIPVTLSVSGAYGSPSSNLGGEGFILTVADNNLSCSASYPVSVDSYYGSTQIHVNATGSVTTSASLYLSFSTVGANTTFYLTTLDGIQHSSALYSTNYLPGIPGSYWDMGFFGGSATGIIDQNNLVGNGVLINTSY